MRKQLRYVLIVGLLICTLLTGCEFLTPDTSNALSQSHQIDELQKQTEQLKEQTEALDRLADSVERLSNVKTQVELK